MLCLVCYLFVISTSVIDCLGRFVPEMTYYVSSGTLNLTKLIIVVFVIVNSVKFVVHLLLKDHRRSTIVVILALKINEQKVWKTRSYYYYL